MSDTTTKKSKKNDSCTELKNIKYQNMLLSNSKLQNNAVSNISNIDLFLNKELLLNKKVPWNKLGKSNRISLIKKYAIKYAEKHNLSEKNKKKLEEYLLICIDRKKLQKIKDIQYDIDKNEIINIPLLYFNKSNEKFLLKRSDKKKKISSCLAPKKLKNVRKVKKTLKNGNKEEKITKQSKTIRAKNKKKKNKKSDKKRDKKEDKNKSNVKSENNPDKK